MAQPFPWEDHLTLSPDQNSVSGDIPYFQDSEGNPIEVDFSDSHLHTNATDGSYYGNIKTTTDQERGPYSPQDGLVYPWPDLQEDSEPNSAFKLSWNEPATDGNAFFDIVVDEVE
ncbi:MAG: hypothetical protein MAG453_00815 [Calditrichaeota bacterium]|nr:hypothetical protein [Calditrichota bacterium]